MIALARADVRRFRTVARRGFPGGRPKGPAPPVRITTNGGAVTLACHLGEVVVALRAAAPTPGEGEFTVSLDALDALDRPGTGTITLDSRHRRAVSARWDDGPAPRSARLAVAETDLAWPDEPGRPMAVAPAFPRALHEAGRSAARETGKYAVTRVQVRGKAGEVIGTDGKQALVWGGFAFPFADDLLVPAVPLFGSKELATEAAVSGGLSDGWLFVVVGPWRVWLRVDPEGRFPDVHAAVPRSCPTRVAFDDRDANALLQALAEWPARGADRLAVTLDLGPTVTARAPASPGGTPLELPLPGTTVTGSPVQVVVNPDHLGRALTLGLRELRVSSPERPVVFRDKDRTFLTAVLDPASAVPPAGADATHSIPSHLTPSSRRRISVPTRDTAPPDRNGHADPAGEQLDPLVEAEGLRTALADAATRATRLVAALRQYRRERRSLLAAWSSLRQLNLGP